MQRRGKRTISGIGMTRGGDPIPVLYCLMEAVVMSESVLFILNVGKCISLICVE